MRKIILILLLAVVSSSAMADNSVLSGGNTEKWESTGKNNEAEILNSSNESTGPDGLYIERVKVIYSQDHEGNGIAYRSVIFTSSVDCKGKKIYMHSADFFDLEGKPIYSSKFPSEMLDPDKAWTETDHESFCATRTQLSTLPAPPPNSLVTTIRCQDDSNEDWIFDIDLVNKTASPHSSKQKEFFQAVVTDSTIIWKMGKGLFSLDRFTLKLLLSFEGVNHVGVLNCTKLENRLL